MTVQYLCIYLIAQQPVVPLWLPQTQSAAVGLLVLQALDVLQFAPVQLYRLPSAQPLPVGALEPVPHVTALVSVPFPFVTSLLVLVVKREYPACITGSPNA